MNEINNILLIHFNYVALGITHILFCHSPGAIRFTLMSKHSNIFPSNLKGYFPFFLSGLNCVTHLWLGGTLPAVGSGQCTVWRSRDEWTATKTSDKSRGNFINQNFVAVQWKLDCTTSVLPCVTACTKLTTVWYNRDTVHWTTMKCLRFELF